MFDEASFGPDRLSLARRGLGSTETHVGPWRRSSNYEGSPVSTVLDKQPDRRPVRKSRTAGRVRRTQEERSADTQRRLMEATIEALDERGYARVTTSEIAERAGVSRGALAHHYATKEELVAVSVEKLLKDST